MHHIHSHTHTSNLHQDTVEYMCTHIHTYTHTHTYKCPVPSSGPHGLRPLSWHRTRWLLCPSPPPPQPPCPLGQSEWPLFLPSCMEGSEVGVAYSGRGLSDGAESGQSGPEHWQYLLRQRKSDLGYNIHVHVHNHHVQCRKRQNIYTCTYIHVVGYVQV